MYVATIEKANGLVNSLIEHGRLSSLGLIVVDEVHCMPAVSPVTLSLFLHTAAHAGRWYCTRSYLRKLLS